MHQKGDSVLRFIRRYAVSAAVGVCAVLAGPLASAHASNATIRATISNYSPRLGQDEARVARAVTTYKKHHSSALVGALRHEVTDLRALRTKLIREPASTARGRTGKTDVTQGLGLIASAYAALARDLAAASRSRPVSRAKVLGVVATDRKGRAKLRAGLKLLG